MLAKDWQFHLYPKRLAVDSISEHVAFMSCYHVIKNGLSSRSRSHII